MEMEPEWLVARREASASRVAELDLPTTKTPGWEFTDLVGADRGATSRRRTARPTRTRARAPTPC